MKTLNTHSKRFYLFILLTLLSVGISRPLTVSAAPARQNSAFVFAVIGDYGSAGQPEADVAKLVKSWNPGFIVTVGDNNYPDGADYSLDANIGQYYHDYIFKYSGKFGNGADTRRFFPVLGNHDWHNGSVNPHTNYFNLPGNERYYDFVQGSVHFFMLDSVASEPDGNTADSGQAKWLKQALANSTSAFNVVVTHYAPYSSGKHGAVPFMQWPFKEWGADIVLAGHDHDYERLMVNGLPYIVNGLGGDDLSQFRATFLPESIIHYNSDFGAMRVEATDSSMKFQFITRGGILIDEYTLGSNPIVASIPVVSSITSASAQATSAAQINFNVAFSEPVTGVDVSDFLLTANNLNGASISAVNGLGATYTVTVNTGAGDGNLRLDLVDNDSIINASGIPLANTGAGNGNFSSANYTIDKTAPITSAITRMTSSPTNAATVNFAATFSEPVLGVDLSDFGLAVQNGSSGAGLANLSGSGATYVVTVNTGSADNFLRLDLINNGSITDAAGNPLPGGNFSTGESYTVDRIAPSVVSIARVNPNPSNALSVDYNVTFSESVSNVDASDFTLNTTGINGAYISNIVGSGNTYVASVNTGNGSGSGDLHLDLTNNPDIVDGVGNAVSAPFTGETYTIDKTVPVILAITRIQPALTNASNVDFNVIFSDAVSGVDVTDFVLNTAGVSGAYISSVNGAGVNYVVSVSTGVGDGTLQLNVLDDDSVINAVGIPLGTAGFGNGNFSSGEIYMLDKTQPMVISIMRADANPTNAANVSFNVTFSEPVSGVDASDFFLNTISGAFVNNISGNGASYTVSITTGNGLDTPRLDFISNGSIFDVVDNTTNGNFLTGEMYTVNKVIPVVTSIARANQNPINGMIAGYIVNFSEPVSGVDASDFVLNTAGVSGASITGVSGVNSTYFVSIQAGVNSGAIRLDLVDNNSIVNSFGNLLGGANLNDGNFVGETYDVTKPTTIDITPPAVPTLLSPANNAALSARYKFTWSKIHDATRYQIEIDNNPDFSSPEWNTLQRTAEYRISAMPKRTIYYWHVRAKDMAGNWSAWSAPFTLIVP